MSRKLLIEREPLRALVIAALMIACLAAAMAVAHVAVVSDPGDGMAFQRVRVHELTLQAPQSWQPVDAAGDDPLLPVSWRSETGESLTVFRLPSTAPRSLGMALSEARAMLPPHPGRVREKPMGFFRHDTLVGLGIQHQLEGDRPTLRLVTVFSQDARTHWVAILYLPAHGSAPREVRRAETLYERICRSLALSVLQPVSPEQLVARGYEPLISWLRQNDGYAAVQWSESKDDEPIVLAATKDQDHPQIAILRMRVMRDATLDGEAGAPDALLLREFEQITSRQPQRSEVRTIRLGDREVRQMLLSDGVSEMVRLLSFARLRDGRAALIEALVSRTAGSRFVASDGPIESLLGALDSAGPVTGATAFVSDATARGQALTQRIASDFSGNQALAEEYSLHQVDGQYVGLMYNRVLPRAADQPLAIQGRIRFATRSPERVTVRWQAADDLSVVRLEEERQLTLRSQQVRFLRRRYEVIGNQLTLSLQTAADRWVQTRPWLVPANYVPPIAEDHWPLDLMQSWNGEPALLWLSRGMSVPTLCMVRLADRQGARQVHIRPVMSMDETVYTLNAAGKVIRSDSRLSDGQPLGGPKQAVITVSRQDLLDLDPSLAELIDRFEHEEGEEP